MTLSANAQLDDTLSTAEHFGESFGPLQVQANTQGGGSATLTRLAGQGDAGVDWLINGNTDIPLDADHDQLKITPQNPVKGGFYVASLLFFGNDGEFIAEEIWVEDTNEATPHTIDSVKDFASQRNVAGAARYRLRLRINPVGKTSAGFTFTHIAATNASSPEPE